VAGPAIHLVSPSGVSIIASVASPGNVASSGNYYVGYKFVPTNNLSVTSLGLLMATGNTGSPVVYLLNTGGVLASAAVALTGGTVGVTYYTSISPVALTAGTTYYIVYARPSVWQDAETANANVLLNVATLTNGVSSTSLGSWSTGSNCYYAPAFLFSYGPVLNASMAMKPYGSLQITLPQAPTPGNLLIGFAADFSGVDIGTYWTNFGTVGAMRFYYHYVQSGDTATLGLFTPSESGYQGVAAYEVSGCSPTWASAFDQKQHTTTTAASVTTSTLTTAATNELALLFATDEQYINGSGLSVSSPWTTDFSIGGYVDCGVAGHQAFAALGASVSATVAFPAGTGYNDQQVGIVLLRPGGGGASLQSFMGQIV
jgi:hypothetical protein